MPYLRNETITKAARRLFATANSYALDFFALKAEGVSPHDWHGVTSTNDLSEGLKRVAGQPDGFAGLVADNFAKFPSAGAGAGAGRPTQPQGNVAGYGLFFPATNNTRFLLRKNDSNRSAVYTHLTKAPPGDNPEKATFEQLYAVRAAAGEGIEVRLADDYVYSASWYYGPTGGKPMRIPIVALAVWMHRGEDLAGPPEMNELVASCVQRLNITEEERALIFGEDGFEIGADDYVDAFDLADYFDQLCFGTPPEAPALEVDEGLLGADRADWNFMAAALGLRESGQEPLAVAQELVDQGARNLLFNGPPRTGKSHDAEQVAAHYLDLPVAGLDADARFSRVQFHHAWTYGDFLRKLMPTVVQGSIAFVDHAGPFLRHCSDNADGRSVFLIEEVNRANVPEVLGEAFHLVEVGYRGRTLLLAGKQPEDDNAALMIPADLLLIMTANNVDRSTLPLDFAFLSRLATVDFPARYDLAYKVLITEQGWPEARARDFILLLRDIENISRYPIGHAYFYSIGPPESVPLWYRTTLRPALALFLTEYRAEDLARVDAVVDEWS